MIKIGIAGTRGLSSLMGLNSIEDVKITAMCDLDEGGHREKDTSRLGA